MAATEKALSHEQLSALSAPSRLDLAIAKVFPKWAVARLRARREFSYEAARSTRLRNSATQLQGPEDYTAFTDRLQLIRQVRDLEQNFGLFQSIIDKLAIYGFGKLRYQARTGDEAIDQQYEDYLAEWFENCDITGRNDFQQIAAIAFKSMLRDGDIGQKWRRDGQWLKLQGIESDRIGGNTVVSTAPDYFQGITVDLETGKPLAYDVYRRTKANAYTDKVTIPASEMLLLFDPRRIDQYRGITPFAPIINEARDLKEVLEACLQGTKFENYHAAIGYTPSGQPLQDPSSLITGSETDANGNPVKEQQLKYGMIQWAPSDAEYEFMKSDRPSGTFQTYVEMLIRLQGIALNLPYSFMYSMIGTGPAVRADLEQAHRVMQWHQQNVCRRFLKPAVKMALMDGIASGALTYTPNWARGRFSFPPKASIDAGRDSQAKIAERNAGLRSNDSIFDEEGEDAQEQERIIAEEATRTLEIAKEISEETGVELPIVLTMLGTRTQTGFLFKTPENQLADGEMPEGGESESEDDSEEADDEEKAEMSRKIVAQSREKLVRELQNRGAREGLIEKLAAKIKPAAPVEVKAEPNAELNAAVARELSVRAVERRAKIEELKGE